MSTDRELAELGVTSWSETEGPVDLAAGSPDDLRRKGLHFSEHLATGPLREQLQLAFPSGIELLRPDLAVSKTRLHGPRMSVGNASGTDTNWAGAVAGPHPSGPYRSVSALWIVPSVSTPGGQVGGYSSSAWAGIDGSTSNDVFQAGTTQDVSFSGTTEPLLFECWYEWFPAFEVVISNLAVAAGHTVFVSLLAESPTSGFLLFSNVTTKQGVSLTFSAPQGTALVGDSAEWILERPRDNGSLTQLPAFSDVHFSQMGATTSGSAAPLLGGAGDALVDLIENGTVVAEPTATGPGTMTIGHPAPSSPCTAVYAAIRDDTNQLAALRNDLTHGGDKASTLRQIAEVNLDLRGLERQKAELGCP